MLAKDQLKLNNTVNTCLIDLNITLYNVMLCHVIKHISTSLVLKSTVKSCAYPFNRVFMLSTVKPFEISPTHKRYGFIF